MMQIKFSTERNANISQELTLNPKQEEQNINLLHLAEAIQQCPFSYCDVWSQITKETAPSHICCVSIIITGIPISQTELIVYCFLYSLCSAVILFAQTSQTRCLRESALKSSFSQFHKCRPKYTSGLLKIRCLTLVRGQHSRNCMAQ